MRQAGILAPISTLPSKHGIGDFGSNTFKFIDLIANANVKVWQILPINPVGYGNSPYQPLSSYAGEELYINLDILVDEGLVQNVDTFEFDNVVKYDDIRNFKAKYFQEAYQNFMLTRSDELVKFAASNDWVTNYAKFITLKKHHNLRSWVEWDEVYKNYFTSNPSLLEFEDKINYEIFIQYMFLNQWNKVKEYANSKGIKVMGDIPIYVGIDSQDVWESPEQFLLDENKQPTYIAGVPPDAFSTTGQRWGNPIYDWEYMKNDNFKFWIKRLKVNQSMFDILRIDHFRAFDTYWKVPATEETAINGEWIEAPGYELFDTIYKELPNIEIVVEDLGDLRPEVLTLRDHYDLAGMKVMQMAYGVNGEQDIFDSKENMIVYTGTHDNNTSIGWYNEFSVEEQKMVEQQLYNLGYYGPFIDMFIYHTLSDISNLAVIPIWDILCADETARFNVPSTLGSPNWEWRFNSFEEFTNRLEFIKTAIIATSRK